MNDWCTCMTLTTIKGFGFYSILTGQKGLKNVTYQHRVRNPHWAHPHRCSCGTSLCSPGDRRLCSRRPWPTCSGQTDDLVVERSRNVRRTERINKAPGGFSFFLWGWGVGSSPVAGLVTLQSSCCVLFRGQAAAVNHKKV